MKTTTLVLAFTFFGIALLAAPLEFSPAPTAAASMCYVSDDPVQDLKCSTRCAYADPNDIEGTLEPRPCPM